VGQSVGLHRRSDLPAAEPREIHNRWIADRELATARSEHARLETEAAKTSSAVDAVHESWKTITEKAGGTPNGTGRTALYFLANREAPASTGLTLEQQVSHALRLA